MKLNEVFTSTGLFDQPYLKGKVGEHDKEMAASIYNLRKIKDNKKKYKSLKYLDYLLYKKYRMF